MAQKIGVKELGLRKLAQDRAREANARPRSGSVSVETLRRTGSFSAKANLDAEAKAPAQPAPEKTPEPPAPPADEPKESVMAKKASKKKPAKKKAAKRKPAVQAKKKASKPRKAKRGGDVVTAKEVADFICRPFGITPGSPGGASMAELETEFKIKSHPMRAKIHFARHKLGYVIEHKDGRYTGTAPTPEPKGV